MEFFIGVYPHRSVYTRTVYTIKKIQFGKTTSKKHKNKWDSSYSFIQRDTHFKRSAFSVNFTEENWL